MSEENNSEQTSGNNSEQSSEQVNTTEQTQTNTKQETQQASTGEQVDTSKSIETNGSEVGLQRKEVPDVDSGLEFSKGLDDMVKSALNGNLSDEQRAALDKQGLGDHFDMIVSGHKAKIAANDAEIVGVVGSKESYSELQEWALANLDDSDIKSFNLAVIESGDIGLAKLAVEGLQARYLKANGHAPEKRIEAGGTANDATRPYSHRDEYINETRSMKYRQDPEYAAKVEAKRSISGF